MGKKMRRKKRTKPAKPRAKAARRKEWSLVTFEQLETWRAKHQIPRKKLAHLLGVTNSTWHNWARGKSVATAAAQKRIKNMISGRAPATAPAPRPSHVPPARQPGSIAAAASIVNTYMQRGKRKASAQEVLEFLREVMAATAV